MRRCRREGAEKWRSGGRIGEREHERLWEIDERKRKTAVLEVEHLGVN
ncbi:MAG: hypothetical protein ACKESB_00685 [Candidatus Hodgkinia cicadicola]